MNQKQIEQMFEGRWRMKGDSTLTTLLEAVDGKLTLQELSVRIASLCRDFFEAGITLGNDDYSIQRENPIPTGRGIITVEEGITHTKELRFKTWWELYDLKCGRKDCLKKWMKMSMDEIQACIDATPAYVASTPDKQFRKRPLTYLNQQAYYDEIIQRNSKDQQRSQRIAEAANLVAKYTGADKGTKG